MDDPVAVGGIQVEPAFTAILVDGRVLRMTVCRQDVTIVGLLDSLRNRVYPFACLIWISVSSDDPDNVVESAITPANIPSPISGFLGPIRLKFLDPPLVSANVAKVDRR